VSAYLLDLAGDNAIVDKRKLVFGISVIPGLRAGLFAIASVGITRSTALRQRGNKGCSSTGVGITRNFKGTK
jgi:hypothetical protein